MRKRKFPTKRVIGFLIIVLILAVYYFYPNPVDQNPPATNGVTPSPAVLSVTTVPEIGNQTKFTDCKSDGVLPDPACTPGAIDPNVTAKLVDGTICISGYTEEVRPPTSKTNKIKVAQLEAYGFTGPMSDYELDHLISLALGGCADCVSNLWPEPYNIPMGAREKDKVENYLHRAVCNGEMTLEEAQKEIATDWTKVYYRVYGNK